jgi:hypothetical protein
MNLIEKLAPAFFHRPLQIVVEHIAQLRISAKTIFAISNALALNRQRFKVFQTQQSEVLFTPTPPRVRIDVASNFPADDPQRSDENKCKK